ncbi:MAG TPA: efflux RND transporter periplasmic adaptor subunit [Bryobacteraceae bacterium]
MHLDEPIIEEYSGAPITPKPPKRKPALYVAGATLFFLLLAAGVVPKLIRSSEAAGVAHAAETAIPVVTVARAQPAPPSSELTLPGNVEAVYVSSIYARSNGYVKKRLVDIGDRVKAGQLLAEIESPEVEQELSQAIAALGQTRAAYEQATANFVQSQAAVNQAHANVDQSAANQEIARTTDQRWSRLVNRGVLSKQDGDEKRSAFAARSAEVAAAQANLATAEANVKAQQANITAARANIAAAQANVNRLRQMVSFENVTAPFDGVITERHVERGDLITAGSGAAQTSLFAIAQANLLRVQVHVPQAYAPDIQNGQAAQLDVHGRSGSPIIGRVVRSANSLNSDSRTLLAEVQVDNRDGALLPGMYADVKFTLPRGRSLVLIPADTLVVNGQGTRVLRVMPDGKLHFIPVTIGRDLGAQVEVTDGLHGDEELVANPGDDLSEGQAVRVQARNAHQAEKS